MCVYSGFIEKKHSPGRPILNIVAALVASNCIIVTFVKHPRSIKYAASDQR